MPYSEHKLEITTRLGDSWSDLADVLQVPTADQRAFRAGREAKDLWEWLEARGRLDFLRQALQHVGRGDLVGLLWPPEGCRHDVSRLPSTFSSLLFGRQEEMDQLFAAWESVGADKTNIVALDAMGGTGKTALVSHFIDTMRREGWRGAKAVYAWSFYSQGTDNRRRGSAEQFLETALTWFDHDGSTFATQHDKGVRLAELIARQRTLLVLDGLEPLQYAAGRLGGGQGVRGIAGSLKEPGLAALFKQLALENPGLLIITTRLHIPDLNGFPPPGVLSCPLEQIGVEPGVELLRSLGVRGTQEDLAAAVVDFRGHALALTTLGRYLAIQTDGDVMRRDTIPRLVDIGGDNERDPFRVMQAYETLLRRQADERSGPGHPAAETAAAKQLAVLFLIGLFDRPVERAAIDALLAPPAIVGPTEGLANLTRPQWNLAVKALRDMGLLAPPAHRSPDELDAHPLIREYFGTRLSQHFEGTWREAHARLWHHYAARTKVRTPQTIDDLTNAERAIAHAVLAGHPNEAVRLYERWIKGQIVPKGLHAFDISILLNFFDDPWIQLNAAIPEAKQASLLAQAELSLRCTGRLAEAAEAIEQNCVTLMRRQQWKTYVEQKVELVQILIQLGQLERATTEAAEAVNVGIQQNVSTRRADLECFAGHALHMRGSLDEAAEAFIRSADAAKARKRPPSGKARKRSANAAAAAMDVQRSAAFRRFAINEFLLDRAAREGPAASTRATLEKAHQQIPTRWARPHALSVLALGRLGLLEAEAETDRGRRQRHLDLARDEIDRALTMLRANNQLDELPRALVARAVHRRVTGQFNDARKDLGEAFHIARYFVMPLFTVDVSIEAVRLELTSGSPVEQIPASEHLSRAEELVNETGYERRRAEIKDLVASA